MNALKALAAAGLVAAITIVALFIALPLRGATTKPAPRVLPPINPTSAAGPLPTAVVTAIVVPGASTVTQCQNTASHCRLALLYLINRDRAAHGVPLLRLDKRQTLGHKARLIKRRCAGTRGHNRAMAKSGYAWHTNRRYPHAGYPADICKKSVRSAENVAVTAGPMWAGIESIQRRMAGGQSSGRDGANILSPAFSRVGIDVVQRRGRVYVTEDFLAH